MEIARLVNEYTSVQVQWLRGAAGGSRLQVRSERTGDVITLDPVALEAIASMDHRGIGALTAALTEAGTANAAVGIDDRLPNAAPAAPCPEPPRGSS